MSLIENDFTIELGANLSDANLTNAILNGGSD